MVKLMSDIAKAVGQRIRNYRTKKGLSQEKLAELSAINEAASINADSDDVVYNLKSLFNAQM